MSTFKAKDGKSWEASFYYIDYQGKRKQKHKRGFKGKKEAEKWKREFLVKMASDPTMTFGSMYELYYEDLKSRTKEVTIANKEKIFNIHVLPFFKDMSVSDITPLTIREWQNKLLKKDYSNAYIGGIQKYLNAFFNYAIKFHNLKSNPLKIAGKAKLNKPKKEMEIWEPREFERFINTFPKEDYLHISFFSLLFYGGFRIGEVLALRLNDINFKNNTIKIDETKGFTNKGTIVDTPKTEKSNRTVDMPLSIMQILAKHINTLYCIEDKDFIYSRYPSSIREILKRHLKKAELKDIRIHDLRHSHVSMLIHMNVNVVDIANRVGHDNPTTTLNTYSHMYSNNGKKIADLLENNITKVLP